MEISIELGFFLMSMGKYEDFVDCISVQTIFISLFTEMGIANLLTPVGELSSKLFQIISCPSEIYRNVETSANK